MFNRPPRIQHTTKEYEIALIPPPQMPPRPTINWATVGLPILAIGLILLLMFLTSNGAFGVSYWVFLPFMLIAPIASVISYHSQLKQHRALQENQIANFKDELDRKGSKISERKQQQLAVLLRTHPSPQECGEIVSKQEMRLGERRPEDSDFLTFRLGLGQVESHIRVGAIPTQNRDPGYGILYDVADHLVEQAAALEDAPVLCDLKQVGSLGVAGKVNELREFGWAAVIQLICHHWPAELNVAVFSSLVEMANWKWLNGTRHGSSIFSQPVIELRQSEAVKSTLVVLEEELRRRKAVRANLRAIGSEQVQSVKLPALLVIFDRITEIYDHAAFALLLKEGSELGVYGIFLVDNIEAIPAECGAIVSIDHDGISFNQTGPDRPSSNKIKPDKAPADLIPRFSQAVENIRWLIPEQVTEPPKHLTLLGLFPYAQLDDLPLETWWGGKHPFKYLRAPIGKFSPTAELIFDLNESDDGHGPHGLIGGMTGSGKSELLKTMILSLSLTHHPYDLNFALIDYKGGGAFDGFEVLPHVVGVITDIQNHADYATRVIQALAWEVKRREGILAGVRARFGLSNSHVDDYRKSLKVKVPIPRLIIIFDEFAEFQERHQEEAKKLINIARVGRSLGIHLILCTQNPMGKAVDQQVRDNSRFTICLKVKTPETSKGLVNIPDAVQLKTGEAFFHVDGPQKFRVAYTAADFLPVGNRRAYQGVTPRPRRYLTQRVTESQAILEEISTQARELKIPALPRVWLEPLPERLAVSELIKQINLSPRWTGSGWSQEYDEPAALPLGLMDDPLHQRQPVFDLRDHLLIFGPSGSGKSTFLLSAAMTIGQMYSPAEAHIYCIDISGQSPLKVLDANGMPHLPRQGGVIYGSDIERLNRLFKMLRTEFASRGTTYNKQTQDAKQETAKIFLLIDGISKQFNADNPGFQQQLDFVMRYGAALGIYVLMAGNLPDDVPAALRADRSIVLLQATDRATIFSLVGRAPETYQKKIDAGQEPSPGRGIINTSPPKEFQGALPTTDEVGILNTVVAVCEAMKDAWSGSRAPDVEKLAEMIPASEIAAFSTFPSVPIGKGLESLEPVGFTLNTDGPLFTIAAMSPGLGKTSTLYLWLSQVANMYKPQDLKLVLIDYHSRTMGHLAHLPHIVKNGTIHTHVTRREGLKDVVDWLSTEVNERKDKLAKAYSKSPKDFDDTSMIDKLGKILLVIDDYESFVNSEPPELKRLHKIIMDGEEVGVRLILTEDHALLGSLGSDDLIKRAKKYATGILLGGSEGLTDIFGTRPPNNQKTANLAPGRGYLVRRGQAELIQVAAYLSNVDHTVKASKDQLKAKKSVKRQSTHQLGRRPDQPLG